ncbi:hypothetical protein [Blastococcus sp. TF02A-35]|uniref:hypothetical protein n=1 Tax=Blastococcus sp. TF02A-35 TaxID=2559612 RepID=UPI001073424B|nr:hypothetical protein [Blastococcus sp. TF02A_35]TFV50272.1 hypothetical protein E4P43_11515 [Blastococcus sp. TF02A_35]
MLGLPAAAIAALMWAGTLLGGIGGGPYGFGPLSVLVPTLVAVLCALPSTRAWVAARRGTRPGGGTRDPGQAR